MTPTPRPALYGARRIDVVDVLRGIAVLGILLVHNIEHFCFYSFPPVSSNPLVALSDKAVWDSAFFLFGGKAYAFFSLLFGFTFFLQDERCRREGKDFRLRFVWRMVLLFLFGNINGAFFPGEILVLYSMVGMVLPLVARLPDKAVLAIAVLLLLQPDIVARIVHALATGGGEVGLSRGELLWNKNIEIHQAGDFRASILSNLTDGQAFSLLWSRDFGRMVQSPALMMMGMLIGRRGLVDDTEKNIRFWLKAAFAALLCYFPLAGLAGLVPGYVENPGAESALVLLLETWGKLAFMVFMLGAIIVLFHRTRLRGALMRIATPFGRMSLTMYIAQSVLGSFLYLPWGLDLGRRLGSTATLPVAAVMFAILYIFAVAWLKRHKYGPLELVWRKWTWVI